MNNLADEEELQFKVVLLGSMGTGKTSLINRIIYGTFNEKTQSTIATAFTTKKINFKNFHKSIKLNIWDTAGQEKFKSLNQLYYKDADCILLIYDINEPNSINEIQEYYEIVKNNVNVNNVLLCIVGTKLDLYYDKLENDENDNENNDNNNKNNKNKNNEINNNKNNEINNNNIENNNKNKNIDINNIENEIKNFANKINVKICKKTSSLLNIGIDDLFNEIAFNLYFDYKTKKNKELNSIKISVFEFPKEENKICC
jgi:small GTP-binding protein